METYYDPLDLAKFPHVSEHAPALVNNRSNTGVGRAQHITAGFQRAHLRNLQMLLRPDRTAEPGIVADVDQQRRLW